MQHSFKIAVLAAIFSLPHAHAQLSDREDALAAIEACRAIKADPVRLACMDAAIQLGDATATTAPTKSLSTVESASTAAVELAAITAEREALALERTALENERNAIETASSAPVERPISTERLRFAENEAFDVQISEIIRSRRTGRLRFVTSEGLILGQATDRLNFQPPDALPVAATISFGLLGSKWITFANDPKRKHKITVRN